MGSCPDKLPICWQYPYVENTLNTPNLVRGYGTQSAGASPLRLRGSLGTAARCHCPASQERTMLQITGPEKDPNAKFEVTVSTKCMSLSHHHEAEKFKSNYPDSGNNSINITKITGIFFFLITGFVLWVSIYLRLLSSYKAISNPLGNHCIIFTTRRRSWLLAAWVSPSPIYMTVLLKLLLTLKLVLEYVALSPKVRLFANLKSENHPGLIPLLPSYNALIMKFSSCRSPLNFTFLLL